MSRCGKGVFTISLDFELYWGVLSRLKLSEYKEHLRGTPEAIHQLLSLFQQYDIHATWACVGFLMESSKENLLKFPTEKRPNYRNSVYNAYPFIHQLKVDEEYAVFARDIINNIRNTPNQEIGTHTYGHYFCLETGQTLAQFQADIQKALEIAQKMDISIKSIVFPRNQYNGSNIEVCQRFGIHAYRGNPKHWIYQPRARSEENLAIRMFRLLDTYINLSGYQIQTIECKQAIVNVPASRFLRPYDPNFKCFEILKLNRIKNEMTKAAELGNLYHLWWHPHNFGVFTEENIFFLKRILEHFLYLKKKYSMVSLNMSEIATQKMKNGI